MTSRSDSSIRGQRIFAFASLALCGSSIGARGVVYDIGKRG